MGKTAQLLLLVWCLIKNRDNFNFTCLHLDLLICSLCQRFSNKNWRIFISPWMLHVLATSSLISDSYGIRRTVQIVKILTVQFSKLLQLWFMFYMCFTDKLNILPQSQNLLLLALRRLSRTIFSRSSLVAVSLRLVMVECNLSISVVFSFSFCFCFPTVCCHRFRSSHLATSSADWNCHHNMFTLI
jgi:hypothetical protein